MRFAVLFALFSSLILHGMDEPIFAIMITGKDPFHYPFALRSIQSFQNQTYPNKHLLIVNDGDQTFDFLDKEWATEIKLDSKYPLGALRNIALDSLPENALWIQWDDDDWHHPSAMEEQYKYMIAHGADLCYMQKQIQYAFKIDSAWEVRRVIEGTILCRKKNDIVYPEISKGEDTDFFERYRNTYRVVGWDNPSHYYIRFIHGHNSWSESHFSLDRRRKKSWAIGNQEKEYLKEVLPLYCHKLNASEFPLFFWTPNRFPSNFGDALSPLIVERLIGKHPQIASSQEDVPKLLGGGSILHFARDGDCIWGSGLNGKIGPEMYHFRSLDVRAVRGPLTRDFLLKRDIVCPEVYGDPALLMPLLFPELVPMPQKEFILIPNLNEIDAYQGLPNVVLPTAGCMEVVHQILKAKKVISGSLHGIIVAESFGIPAILLRLTHAEPLLKYRDYYLGTGRNEFPIAYSLEEALQLPCANPPCVDLQKLLESFPR